MYRFLAVLACLVVLGLAGFWIATMPRPLPDDTFAGLTGDAARGEVIFWAGGCASCHAAPGAKGEGEDRLVLAGGRPFPSDFGTFHAPNISPGAAGIGGWSVRDLGNAMRRGLSPGGAHYYPAFPYTSYIRAAPQDIADLHAFLQTLPASDTPNIPHEVGFPFSVRRLLGGWKLLFLSEDWVLAEPETDEIARGRYLVEALGHCAECHTPRNALGAPDRDRWLAGAPSPDGPGTIPNITPARLDWSAVDIAAYLKTGFTPDFDSAGGDMAEVVQNLSHLSDADLAAIAAYLKAVPPVE
ncbi:Diheme class I cytochrome c [Pseudooceanicola batsensis HTCC2597]|uniref:Diheme class I cytochrome c n=1 Tax=Pseudooceanicola batsensis (strain ATCC BAA-863 / DSM 15984 / KCTC 12145 / HTCC2597) TaxID=252305 RepID=A3TXK4_PSEBH|nr:cytochrome c [Pseudooceanicola batsensis]EAQ03564.1 Diheme class I cytochrome c [Pseudooceanicola batsensis HTCC2597]